ncbi:putative UVR domain-containing protein [Helianthus debilis subsp. tardiflorus]
MDDMEDSLFEGMVLFDPSSSSPQFPALDHTNKHDDSVELSNHHEISQQSVQSTTSGASFEPLDENLFSDLTLIQPQSEYDDVSNSLDPPLSPSSSSTSSRSTVTTDFAATTSFASIPQTSITSTRSLTSQISSTRKKKRAGLRIGYGRTSAVQSLDSDSAIDVDNSQVPVPASVSVSSVSSPVVVSQVKLELEEEKPQNRVTESEIRSEIKVVASETEDLEGGIEINEAVTTSSTIEHKVEEEQEVAEDESKEDSIEVRYEQVKKQVAEKLDHARGMVASVSGKRKEVIRKRRKAAEELNSVSVKYKEMEKELEEAVESEDFETAERVSDGLAAAEKEKEVLSVALREAEAECDAIDLKMQEALEMQIVAEEECAALLQSFAVDADHNADSIITNAKTKTSEEMEKWVSLSEALEVKKMEAEIESDVLSGARKGLDDSIEHIVKEDKQKSQLLHEKKKILADELQELLALVKQKEAEISENNSQIEEIDKKMAGAVSSFQDALSDIDLKSANLQSGLSQLESESDDLSKRKKEIDDFALQEEARGLKIRELGRVSADEAAVHQEVINMRKSLIKFISKSREDKIRLAATEQKLFDDVQMLKQDISAVRASLQDLSSTKSGTQQSIESFKQRLLFIEKRVPEMESEKRVFATARNFKEAARIANEAKALYVEKETLQLKIDEDTTTLKKIEDDINHNVQKLQEKEENIALMEKELETVRYQRLILLAGAATAEQSAAMKLGDVEEADILLQEAQAADSEAKKIQPDSKNEKFDSKILNSFISMELVSTLDKNQLAELVASTQISAP